MNTDATTIADPLSRARLRLGELLRGLEKRSHGLFGAQSLRTAALLAITRAGGPVLSIVVAGMFGASAATDRFFLVFAVATYVLETVTAIAEATAVPFMVEARVAGRATRRTVARVVAASGAMTGMLAVAAGAVAVGSGRVKMDGELLAWLVPLTVFVVVGGMVSALTGSLYAARRYELAAAASGLRPLAAIVVLFTIGQRFGIAGYAIGLAAGVATQLLVLGMLVSRTYEAQGARGPSIAGTSRFLREAGLQLAGSLTMGLMPLVDRLSASTLTPGSVSVLEYATRLWSVPVTLTMAGALVVCLTDWSELGVADKEQLHRSVAGASRVLLAAAGLVALAIIVARSAIVAALLNWGSLTQAQLVEASTTLGVLALGVPLYLVGLLHARAILAIRQARLLLLVAIISLAGKLLLNSALAPTLGVVGIAWSTSIVYAVGCGVLILGFRRSLARWRAPEVAS